MSVPLSSLSSVASAVSPAASSNISGTKPGNGFASALEGAIQAVEKPGQDSSQAIQNFLNGDGEELHNVALKVQQASLAFDLGVQIRNKVVSAYQEIMRMQV